MCAAVDLVRPATRGEGSGLRGVSGDGSRGGGLASLRDGNGVVEAGRDSSLATFRPSAGSCPASGSTRLVRSKTVWSVPREMVSRGQRKRGITTWVGSPKYVGREPRVEG